MVLSPPRTWKRAPSANWPTFWMNITGLAFTPGPPRPLSVPPNVGGEVGEGSGRLNRCLAGPYGCRRRPAQGQGQDGEKSDDGKGFCFHLGLLFGMIWTAPNGAAVEPHAAGARQRPCKCRP
jgi:hypothetical protein